MAIEIYRQLIVRGSPEILQKFETLLESSLTGGWVRGGKRESELPEPTSQMCFQHLQDDEHVLWEVWLARDLGDLHSSRVLGSLGTEVSREEYNQVLHDFYTKFVKPAADESEASVYLGAEEAKIEDWMSAETLRLLVGFAGNPSLMHPTAALHAFDEERLENFIISAHAGGGWLDAVMLKRWLVEERGWPEEAAASIAERYETGRSLLRVYDASRLK